MTIQIIINIPDVIEMAFEIVALPLTGPALPPDVITKEVIKHDFIPDRRSFTFRLIGKPSLSQSPPVFFSEITTNHKYIHSSTKTNY